MQLLSPPAVARADTKATPADCLPGPFLSLGSASHFTLIDLQGKPLLKPDRPQLRPGHAMIAAGAGAASAVLAGTRQRATPSQTLESPPRLPQNAANRTTDLPDATGDPMW